MPRPCKNKFIENEAKFKCFKPAGIPRENLEKIQITPEEFEAFRLSYHEGLNNILGAEQMQTSAPTFNRLNASFLKKLADALVNGKGIQIYK